MRQATVEIDNGWQPEQYKKTTMGGTTVRKIHTQKKNSRKNMFDHGPRHRATDIAWQIKLQFEFTRPEEGQRIQGIFTRHPQRP